MKLAETASRKFVNLRDLAGLFFIHWRVPIVFLRPYWDRLWRLLFGAAVVYRATLIRRTRVVAVIGSLGKTTTTRALEALLVPNPSRLSYSNYGSSLAANLLCCRPWDRWWVLEAGIRGPGQMVPYAKMLRPDIVVVTCIKSEHHRSFGTLENTRAEKVEMVRALGPGGLAVLNGDDLHVRWMASQTCARVLTFGLTEGNDVRASGVEVDWPHGTRFVVRFSKQERALRVALLGEHQVYWALAAIAVGLDAGLGWGEVAERLESLTAASGRMEVVTLECGATIIDDSFKAPVASVHASLEILAGVPATRRIAVLGDMDEIQGRVGDFYRDLGRRVAGAADLVILVGSRDLIRLKTGATRAGMDPSCLIHPGSRIQDAIELLKVELRPGDAILIKGGSRRRLQRLTLAMLQQDVGCPARQCTAKVSSCDVCPLLNHDGSAFQNVFIRRYVQ